MNRTRHCRTTEDALERGIRVPDAFDRAPRLLRALVLRAEIREGRAGIWYRLTHTEFSEVSERADLLEHVLLRSHPPGTTMRRPEDAEVLDDLGKDIVWIVCDRPAGGEDRPW